MRNRLVTKASRPLVAKAHRPTIYHDESLLGGSAATRIIGEQRVGSVHQTLRWERKFMLNMCGGS